MKRHIAIWSTLLLLTQNVHAKNFSYPELIVKPSASDRLLLEAKTERKRKVYEPLGMQLSAMATLTAGVTQYFGNTNKVDDPNKFAGLTGMVVGGTWMVINYMQFNRKKAYYEAFKRVKGLPSKSQGDKLTKERLAEEEIAYRASLARKFAYASVGTNLAASLYMMSNAEDDSKATLTNAIAIATSFLPLLFKMREERVYRSQQNYKKKIYAPLVNFNMFFDQKDKKYHPGMALNYAF